MNDKILVNEEGLAVTEQVLEDYMEKYANTYNKEIIIDSLMTYKPIGVTEKYIREFVDKWYDKKRVKKINKILDID